MTLSTAPFSKASVFTYPLEMGRFQKVPRLKPSSKASVFISAFSHFIVDDKRKRITWSGRKPCLFKLKDPKDDKPEVRWGILFNDDTDHIQYNTDVWKKNNEEQSGLFVNRLVHCILLKTFLPHILGQVSC